MAATLVAGCAAPNISQPGPTSVPTVTIAPTPSAAPTASPEPTGSCGSSTIWIDYAPYTTATLAGYGFDFVVADVVGFDPANFNTPDGKRPPGFGTRPSSPQPNPEAETRIYTPVNVLIDHAISGSWSPGPDQFLIEGGTVGCFTIRVDAAPRVNPGSRYVFILNEALDSDGHRPGPEQEVVFAWPADSGGTVTTVDGRMSIDELTRIVREATPSPSPYR